MIKFTFILLIGLIRGIASKYIFWILGGLVIIIYIYFSIWGRFFVPHVFLSSGLRFDQISFSLVILSLFIIVLIYYSRNTVYSRRGVWYFYGLVYVLILVLILTFLITNLLGFYFFFWIYFNSYFINYYRLGVSTRAVTSGSLFFILYIRRIFTFFINYNNIFKNDWGAGYLWRIF